MISNHKRSIAYGSKGLEKLLRKKVNQVPTAREEDFKMKREERMEEARNKRKEIKKMKEPIKRSSRKEKQKAQTLNVDQENGEDNIPLPNQQAESSKKRAYGGLDNESQPLAKKSRTADEDDVLDYEQTDPESGAPSPPGL
jgi:hypothetical protein